MTVKEQVQEACESCGSYAEVGTIIGEGDETVLVPIEGDDEADARTRLARYEAVAREVCPELKVATELETQTQGVVLNAWFEFTCTAERLIFEMRARTL